MDRIINWFEIPVSDFERAVQFYEKVFQATLRRENMSDMLMATFPYTCPHAGGALVRFEHCKPSADGVVVYLHAPELDEMLKRVDSAGGQCVFGPHTLPEDIGRIALVIDSEGNRVGLHEPPPGARSVG